MPHVFISHSSRDDTFVTDLADELRAVGIAVWVDHRDIPSGAKWDREVEKALETCNTMIVVLSAAAVESENVTDEWSYYLDEKKIVFPVLIGNCSVPFRLRRLQRIDFTQDVNAALVELCGALGVEVDLAAEPPLLPFEPETVPVPGGSFRMGSTIEQVNAVKEELPIAEHLYAEAELPQHVVNLGAYRIGKYPVTVGEYRAFIKAGGYAENRCWTFAGRIWRDKVKVVHPYLWTNALWTGSDRLPVIGVSWYEAAAYCHWLADSTGRPYRLPSEAEWEYAARGPQGSVYPWGDSFAAANAVCDRNSGGHTAEVGSKPGGASWVGALDLAGNVWEWVNSVYQPYPYYPDERENNKGAAPRVLRGGSWKNVTFLRSSTRNWDEPSMQDYKVGFRVAL